MALTPEEQKELAALEQEVGSTKAKGLSTAEQEELASLEQEFGNAEASKLNNQEEAQGSILGQTGAAIRSISSGMLPGQNQISAGLSAAADSIINPITDKVFGTQTDLGSFSERYTRNLQAIQEQDQKDAEIYSNTTTAANIIGTVAGVNKFAGAIGATGKGMLALAGADAAFLTAQSISENNGFKNAPKDFGLALAGDVAIQAAMGPLGKVLKGAGNMAGNVADKMLIKSSLNRVIDASSAAFKKFEETYPKGAKQVMNLVGGLDNLSVGKDPTTFKQAISTKMDDIGKNITKSYDELDALTGGVPINPKDLQRKINAGIDSMYKSEAGKASAADIKAKVNAMLYDEVTGDYYVKSAKELFEFRKDFMNIAKNVGLEPALAKKIQSGPISNALIATRSSPRGALADRVSLSGSLKRAIEKQENLRSVVTNLDETAKINGLSPDLSKKIAAAKADLAEAELIVKDATKQGITPENIKNAASTLNNIDNDPGLLDSVMGARDSINKLSKDYEMLATFKDTVLSIKMPETTGGHLVDLLKSRYSAPAIFAGLASGSLKTAALVGLSAQGARQAAAQIEKFSSQTTQGIIRNSGVKLSKALSFIGDNASDPTIRVIGAKIAQNLVNNDIESDEAWANIEGEVAKIDLYQNPIERDERSMIQNMSQIMAIAAIEAPQLAASIAEMQNNQEDIGPVMDQLSKEPSMMKFFKAGIGWGGVVYSPEDKQLLVNQINDRLDIPTVKRIAMINDVMSTGTIPNLNEAPVRQPFIYKPRDRNKER